VNGVTTAQNEVADALSSYFEAASGSANYALTFLPKKKKAREQSSYLRFSTRVTEPYTSPFSIDELQSALKRTRDFPWARRHSQSNAPTPASILIVIPAEHVLSDLDQGFLPI
jgi:hypothetical protein